MSTIGAIGGGMTQIMMAKPAAPPPPKAAPDGDGDNDGSANVAKPSAGGSGTPRMLDISV
jgi:hypothetical protein